MDYMIQLEKVKQIEKEYDEKLYSRGEKFYRSKEAKALARKQKNAIDKYLKKNPKDFLRKGALIYGIGFNDIEDQSSDVQNICLLLGEGKYFEDKKLYAKAVELYDEANKLFFRVHRAELEYNQRVYNNGAAYGEQVTEKRLRICANKLLKEEIKELEFKAKNLENINPSEAINLYDKLNKINPGLKKYNNRIKVCKKKLWDNFSTI